MSGLPRAEVAATPPRVGEWFIDFGPPDGDPVAASDATARRAVAAFVAAFRPLARVERAAADLTWLAADGTVATVAESESVTLGDEGEPVVPDGVSMVTAVFLDCAVRIPVSGEWLPGGLRFVYSCVLDFDDEDRAVPVDAAAKVTISVNAWWGEGGEENRAVLAEALREWERRTGHPIAEWSSGIRPDGIGRHGFTGETT
ncbi:MAG: hypothetical protein ACJ73S_21865 [Mycobacteriales bacterium]